MTRGRIYVSEPLISKNAKKYVNEVLDSGWVSSKGPFVIKFEKKFAQTFGTKYAVATSSGTAALHLALAAINIKSGDEVIVPALTMIAAALPIIYLGAKPILVDSDPVTGNINPKLIEKKINKKTKAIIVVHLNGHPADLNPIIKLAKKHKLKVIEDAAESNGSKYKTANGKFKYVGSIADIGCFSFYGNKVVTTGEGGLAITDDKLLAQKMIDLRNLDRSEELHFLHKGIGYTYRMSAIQAALGLAQLETFQENLKIKKRLAESYISNLKKTENVILPTNEPYAKRIFWNFDLFLNKNSKKSPLELQNALEKYNIETRNFVIPLNLQPAFLNLGLFNSEKYPIAQDLSARGLTLPLGLTLKESEIKYICEIIKKNLE